MKKKDYILFLLVIISIFLITYSGIYLYNYYDHNGILFTYPSNKKNDNLGLTPNEIGDTIGGTLNPIIAFTASILTFLAFYIQYKANNLQIKIFNENIEINKKNEIQRHVTNLNIFKGLINSMIKYYDQTGEEIKNFIEFEKKEPLKINFFYFITNSSFRDLERLDLISIYESITFSFKNKDNAWENEFLDTLKTIDFYQKMIEELKSKYHIHIESKTNNLNKIAKKLNKNIGKVLEDKVLSTLNGVQEYMEIVYNVDKNGNLIKTENEFEGTDFSKLQTNFFNKFIPDLIELNRQSGNKYFLDLEFYSLLNKSIIAEKSQTNFYIKNLEERYNDYFKNRESLTKIEKFIDIINISQHYVGEYGG